ncbi:MAG: AEC family transporter [Marinicellaceae bacterium]
MQNFIYISSLLLLGVLLRRINVFPKNTSQVLNQFVIYVSLPALVLITIPQIDLNLLLLPVAIVPWVLLVVSVVLLLICSKIFKWNNNTLAALLLIVPLGNTSFLGIPMVKSFFGEGMVAYALIYDQLGSFLALALYGSIVLAIFDKTQIQKNKKIVLKNALKIVITFPPFLCLLVALYLRKLELQPIYFNLLTPLASTLVPVIMIAVGFQLSLKLDSGKMTPFAVGLLIKMFIAPAVALFVFVVLDLKGEIYQVIVFEAAMPPMISAGALAIIANLSPRLTAAMLAFGILLSFISLPIFYSIITQLL